MKNVSRRKVHHRVGRRAWVLPAAMLAAVSLAPLQSAAASQEHATMANEFHAWNSREAFWAGQFEGGAQLVDRSRPAITLRDGASTGAWTSGVLRSTTPINELVSSWQADTPRGTWTETKLQVQVGDHWSGWYVMGRWALGEDTIRRTSVNDQDDADGVIYTDTYFAKQRPATAYRLREELHGTPSARPSVYQVAAVAFDPQAPGATSATTMRFQVDLPVPQFSQEVHQGEYPAYDAGGEHWCSPTSTAMVMAYWRRGPSAEALDTLPPDPKFDQNGRVDPLVDWAALHTYDTAYQGAGNWPFNTAYASAYGLDGSVRRLASLREAEAWILRGVPLVVSINWDNRAADPKQHLDGAPVDHTGGHLMVIRGFTASGDVIADDPAGQTNDQVRRIYRRDQFEYRWQDASAGIIYLIKPLGLPG